MKIFFSTTLMMAALFVGSAQAEDTKASVEKKASVEPTREQRQKMAEMHEKMAACLRSEKPVRDCHSEMMGSCREMGKDCPMPGHPPGPMGGPRHERRGSGAGQ